jgi:hypothetical protein
MPHARVKRHSSRQAVGGGAFTCMCRLPCIEITAQGVRWTCPGVERGQNAACVSAHGREAHPSGGNERGCHTDVRWGIEDGVCASTSRSHINTANACASVDMWSGVVLGTRNESLRTPRKGRRKNWHKGSRLGCALKLKRRTIYVFNVQRHLIRIRCLLERSREEDTIATSYVIHVMHAQ